MQQLGAISAIRNHTFVVATIFKDAIGLVREVVTTMSVLSELRP